MNPATLRLIPEEDILDGIEACPDSVVGLHRGKNRGKPLIRLVRKSA